MTVDPCGSVEVKVDTVGGAVGVVDDEVVGVSTGADVVGIVELAVGGINDEVVDEVVGSGIEEEELGMTGLLVGSTTEDEGVDGSVVGTEDGLVLAIELLDG